jgi:transcriptional regulator with XRE-family HTH domain
VLSGHPSTNGFETNLGARVRALRRERGLTLKGLGARAGLSHPFLSQVERGLARPSVASVERIAAALDVSVARLWAPPRHGDAIHITRKEEGTTTERDEQTQRDVLADEPTLTEWSARGRAWPKQPDVQHGDVAIYVARGALEVELGGTVHALSEGDALRFDGAIPHRLRRTGAPSTRALIVTSPA